ncbi:hypothetical protein Q5P01_000994 [Channa striata]|uniref:Uncharacterized protein n=1 Tax=Channa striata TaxID=64152 RepID=A0AA88IG28_CHASR|nr:hypothetical protein Q5P01_000994 [Channa striata]
MSTAALFSGLCGLFGREAGHRRIWRGAGGRISPRGSEKARSRIRQRRLAKVFVAFRREQGQGEAEALALLRKLAWLFDLSELRARRHPVVRGQEPRTCCSCTRSSSRRCSSAAARREDFATIMAWPAPFLEANFCDPCARGAPEAHVPPGAVAAEEGGRGRPGVDPRPSCNTTGFSRVTRSERRHMRLPATRGAISRGPGTACSCGAGYKIEESSGKALCAGQSEGKSLYFGKIFTGPEDKKPPPKYKTTFGDFATVTMGVSTSTEMLSMLDVALAPGKKDKGGGASLRAILSKAHRPAGIKGWRWGRRCRPLPPQVQHGRVHRGGLRESHERPHVQREDTQGRPDGEERVSAVLGAAGLAHVRAHLVHDHEAAVMISLGLFCTELARSVYAASKLNYSALCARLVTSVLLQGDRRSLLSPLSSGQLCRPRIGSFLAPTGSLSGP